MSGASGMVRWASATGLSFVRLCSRPEPIFWIIVLAHFAGAFCFANYDKEPDCIFGPVLPHFLAGLS